MTRQPVSPAAILLSFAAIAAFLVALPGCFKETDEDRIRAVLDEAVEGAEEGNSKKTLARVAEDFRDASGADRSAVRAILAREMLQGNRITVIRRDQKIRVEGDTARASFEAALLRGDRKKLKGLVPERMGTRRFDLSLEKRDGEWWIVSAEHRPIPPAEFVVNDSDIE